MKVQYAGWEDIRELSASDLESSNFKKTQFRRGVPTEVDDEAGQELLGNPQKFGKFEQVDEDEAPRTVDDDETGSPEGVEVSLTDPTGEESEGAANVTAGSGDAATTSTPTGGRGRRGGGTSGSTGTSRT